MVDCNSWRRPSAWCRSAWLHWTQSEVEIRETGKLKPSSIAERRGFPLPALYQQVGVVIPPPVSVCLDHGSQHTLCRSPQIRSQLCFAPLYPTLFIKWEVVVFVTSKWCVFVGLFMDAGYMVKILWCKEVRTKVHPVLDCKHFGSKCLWNTHRSGASEH